jgi:hypothetical protein
LRDEVVVVHEEFLMKSIIENGGCVVDGFDLEVIVE